MSDLISREALIELLRKQRDTAWQTSNTVGLTGDDVLPPDEDENYGDNLDFIITQAQALPAIIPQVVANISGGLLQGASADYPVDVYALDFDDDGSDPDTTIEIDDTTAWLGQTGAEVDPAFVERVINSETLADRCERGEHNWGGEPSVGAECLHCGIQFDG